MEITGSNPVRTAKKVSSSKIKKIIQLDVKSKTNLNLLKDAYSKSKNQTFKLKKQASCKFIGIVTATKKIQPVGREFESHPGVTPR